MDDWAIIPVKSLSESKGRLAHLLSPGQRAQLVRNLLGHVLAEVQRTARISRQLVISRDPEVWAFADAFGAKVVEEIPPYSLNRAVSHAFQIAVQSGANGVLILPADLPFVGTADVNLMIETGDGDERENGLTIGNSGGINRAAGAVQPVMVVSSDRHGEGTNALYLRSAREFDFHFGKRSLLLHIREALKRDYLVRLVNQPGLQFDLDTEEDWRQLQTPGPNGLVDFSPFSRSTINQQ